MQSLYTWRGKYFGFVHDERVYDASGAFFGWIDDGKVWAKDGSHLGEFVPDGYLERPRLADTPFRRVPPLLTLSQTPPLMRPPDRITRYERFGYDDPLETIRS